MAETHGDGNEHAHHNPRHHACANLFGCGDEKGTGIIRDDIKDAAFDNRASDTLLHMDEVRAGKRKDCPKAVSCQLGLVRFPHS
jgi:hypothetical protein